MKINYKIELLSEWHIGSGLDAGPVADAIVLKDEDNLPYIPGKTIKGLLRDSLQEMAEVGRIKQDIINKIFGWQEKDAKGSVIRSYNGNAFFSDAELPEMQRKEIIANNLAKYLYRTISSTKINDKGTAEEKSLRTIEVCVPLTLEGYIETEIENADSIFQQAFKWTRYLGMKRNRGLGRCKFILTEKQ